MEPAQRPFTAALAAASRDKACGQGSQGTSLEGEILNGARACLPPDPLVAVTQAAAVGLALAVRHRADIALDRPVADAWVGPGVGLVGHAACGPLPSTTVAAAVVSLRGGRTPRAAVPPRRGGIEVEIPAEQPKHAVPFARTPPLIDMGPQPGEPGGILVGVTVRLPRDQPQLRRPHHHRPPVATVSTARRRSSSLACKYTIVEASDACPSSSRITSRGTPARTQLVAAL